MNIALKLLPLCSFIVACGSANDASQDNRLNALEVELSILKAAVQDGDKELASRLDLADAAKIGACTWFGVGERAYQFVSFNNFQVPVVLDKTSVREGVTNAHFLLGNPYSGRLTLSFFVCYGWNERGECASKAKEKQKTLAAGHWTKIRVPLPGLSFEAGKEKKLAFCYADEDNVSIALTGS